MPIAARATDSKGPNKTLPDETAPGDLGFSVRSTTDSELASESKTDPKVCEQQPPSEHDRDKSARNFYQTIISKVLQDTQPVEIEISAQEEERQWQRALLPTKVKGQEEEINKLKEQINTPQLTRTPVLTEREKNIWEVIRRGSKGLAYCRELENAGVKPRRTGSWKGCPGTYPAAYQLGEPWRHRIQDEKSRTRRKAKLPKTRKSLASE